MIPNYILYLFLDFIFIISLLFVLNSLAKREKIKLAYMFLALEFLLSLMFIIDLFIHFIILGALFLIYCIIIIILGRKNYYNIVIKEISISGKNIKDDIELVYIADLQFDKRLGSYNEKAFENLITKLDELDFDVLLMGGDYINYYEHMDIFFKYLKELSRKYRIYSSLGNHDFMWKDEMIDKMKDIGIRDLENEYERVNINSNDVLIIGVEDLWTGTPTFPKISNEDKDLTRITLVHNPDVMKIIKNENFGLGLAGHYHRGQVNFIPKLYVARLITQYVYGMYTIGENLLYVTSGIGGTFFRGYISGYVRWNAMPEIVKIKILKDKEESDD